MDVRRSSCVSVGPRKGYIYDGKLSQCRHLGVIMRRADGCGWWVIPGAGSQRWGGGEVRIWHLCWILTLFLGSLGQLIWGSIYHICGSIYHSDFPQSECEHFPLPWAVAEAVQTLQLLSLFSTFLYLSHCLRNYDHFFMFYSTAIHFSISDI